MSTLIVHPTPDKLEALKAFLKALKIDFEVGAEKVNPEFEAKMKRADADKKAGKGRKVTLEELEGLWK